MTANFQKEPKLLWWIRNAEFLPIQFHLDRKQWGPSSVMNTVITIVLAKFSTHCLLSHFFSEAMAEYIIVDDPDSVNEFVLLRGGGEEGMRADVLCTHCSSLGWQWWYSYKWSPLKCRSSLMLCISFIPQLSFLKTGHLSIASLLPHNSWTLTALFPHYLKLRSELVPNKSSSSVPALCSHMAISEKLVKTHER